MAVENGKSGRYCSRPHSNAGQTQPSVPRLFSELFKGVSEREGVFQTSCHSAVPKMEARLWGQTALRGTEISELEITHLKEMNGTVNTIVMVV